MTSLHKDKIVLHTKMDFTTRSFTVFDLDPVTTAIWFLSFDLIVLNILLSTLAHAASMSNNLNSLMLKFLYSL
jgi:hypothetical protein